MSWLENEIWASTSQMTVEEAVAKKAPNPAEFPETPNQSLSYWIRNFAIDFEDHWTHVPLRDTVDVAIIGSGITGASTAYNLSKLAPGLSVAIFDARGLCTGATGRNGGLIGRPEAYDIRALSKIFGLEEAVRWRQFLRTNREMMLAVIEELDAAEAVDLNLKGSMIVFASLEEREEFIKDQNYGRENGLKTESYVIDAEEVVNVSFNFTLPRRETLLGLI
jgi:hypothetical protein